MRCIAVADEDRLAKSSHCWLDFSGRYLGKYLRSGEMATYKDHVQGELFPWESKVV